MNSGPSTAAPAARYPRTARVRARAEFDAIFAKGSRAAAPLLALHYLADDGPPRLGLAVSRKVDTRAVVRNRIKRVLRDHFRRRRADLAGGSYVVVARAPAARASSRDVTAAFEQTYLRILRRVALPPSTVDVTMPPDSPSPEQAPATRGATSPSAP